MLVCRDAAQPMVEAHHALLHEVSVMALGVEKKYNVQVVEERHLSGNPSIHQEDEDKLKPVFCKAERSVDDMVKDVQDSNEALKMALEDTIRWLLKFMVEKGWKEVEGEYSVALLLSDSFIICASLVTLRHLGECLYNICTSMTYVLVWH
jgi:hypothetical protein